MITFRTIPERGEMNPRIPSRNTGNAKITKVKTTTTLQKNLNLISLMKLLSKPGKYK